jgi:signal transduction histidine kinase
LFKYQSGRVIALGRLMLVVLFLLALWFDRTEPQSGVAFSYSMLLFYAVGAVAIAVATWRNWWLDARLAVPMHAVDMAVFTAIVFSTNGSTSPFFLFFVLPLLSAAIRWGWRETSLTAVTLVLLYMGAGLLVAQSGGWELERFVARSGHLIILSLLLIWFGIHQRIGRLFFRVEDFETGLQPEPNPLGRALGFAMDVTGATGGALLMAPSGDETSEGVAVHQNDWSTFSLDRPVIANSAPASFLYDIGKDRAVSRSPSGSFRFTPASSLFDMPAARLRDFRQGLAMRVRTGTDEGWLLLWGIPDMSTDFIDFGGELGRSAAAILERQALLLAIEAGAAARTRLSLARDVHDSIVQFLAGTAFRIEAIQRASIAGSKVDADLDELKRLLVEEQGEIRGFLLALRRDKDLELVDAVAELRALAERLSQQWAVDCSITADSDEGAIPIRLQLDLQQLLREAVANAVRHGGAKRIEVGLAVANDELKFSVADNGTGFSKSNGAALLTPRSLKERVERAHGSIDLVSKPGSTNILISLPLAGAAA